MIFDARGNPMLEAPAPLVVENGTCQVCGSRPAEHAVYGSFGGHSRTLCNKCGAEVAA